jgi:type IV secretion system protein VirD4
MSGRARGLAFWLSIAALAAGLLGFVTAEMVLAAGLAVGGLWLLWFVVGFRGGGLGSAALGLLVAGVVVGLWSGDLGGGIRGIGQGNQAPGSGQGVSGFRDLGIGIAGQGKGIGWGAGGGRVLDLDAPDLVGGSCGRDWGSWVPAWGMGRWVLTLAVLPFAALAGILLVMWIIGFVPLVGRSAVRWVALRVEPWGGFGYWLADRIAPDRLSNIIVASNSGAHGSDRLLTDAEALDAWGRDGEEGFVLGMIGERVLRFSSLGGVLLEAAPDAGKTSSYVIPTLLSPSTESRMIVDVKGELLAKTGGYRETLGQRLLVVDPERITPYGVDRRDARINLLTACVPTEGEDVARAASLLAQALLPRDKKVNNPYFEISATELLEGLILWVRMAPDEILGDRPRDLMTVREHLHSVDIQADIEDKILPNLAGLEPHIRFALEGLLAPFVGLAEATFGSMPQQAKQALKFLDLPGWQRSMCARGEGGVTWAFANLHAPGTDLYICVQPGTLRAYPGAVRSLIAALTESLLAESIRRGDDGLNPKVRMLLDEVDTLGNCEPLIRAVTVGRPAIRPMFVIQGYSQLEATYGRDDAATLARSVAVRIHLATADAAVARMVSDLSGTRTIRDRSMSGQGRGGQSWSFGERSRPVITPGEVVHLPPDKGIVIQRGRYAAIVTKAKGWADAPFAQRYGMGATKPNEEP